MNEQKNLSAIVESILFVYGEPLGIKRLAVIAQASETEVRDAIAALAKNLAGRGVVLLEKDNAWQLGSHPASASYVEKFARDQFGEELSRPALETLAIIAYRGPLSRADIEYIRGVNSSFTLRALAMRGLVERADNSKDSRAPLEASRPAAAVAVPSAGRSLTGQGFLYRVSIDFLKHLGLSRMEDLPRYEELSKVSVGENLDVSADVETRGVPAKRELLASPDAPVSDDEL